MSSIIVCGNPADGFTYTGPFEDGVEANDYADECLVGEEWWVVNLLPPYPESTGTPSLNWGTAKEAS